MPQFLRELLFDQALASSFYSALGIILDWDRLAVEKRLTLAWGEPTCLLLRTIIQGHYYKARSIESAIGHFCTPGHVSAITVNRHLLARWVSESERVDCSDLPPIGLLPSFYHAMREVRFKRTSETVEAPELELVPSGRPQVLEPGGSPHEDILALLDAECIYIYITTAPTAALASTAAPLVRKSMHMAGIATWRNLKRTRGGLPELPGEWQGVLTPLDHTEIA